MNKFCKAVMLTCAIWAGCTAVSSTSAQAFSVQDGVKVQINDSLVSFPEVSPFIDGNGSMLVPLRAVAEGMGYHIDWSMVGSQVKLSIQNGDRTIQLTTGSGQAVVNGNATTLSSPALLKDGHVYVPMRFISESFGTLVQWDDHNGIAIICKDGKYHAPAWWAPSHVQPESASDKIVSIAKSLEGVPYKWGGTTPSGFDCSGFVSYVYNKVGVELPHSSWDMLDSAGNSVDSSSLKPGDLVFFDINSSTGHVGIYLGNNQFISATSSRGIYVDSLSERYWAPKYIGAKRVA